MRGRIEAIRIYAQRGVAGMLALLVTAGFLMALLAWYTPFYADQTRRMYAVGAGREFSQVMTAVRAWIPHAGERLAAAGHDPTQPVTLTLNNLGYLRDPLCNPTSAIAFLPCPIANYGATENPYGGNYTSELRYLPGAGPLGAPYVEVRVHYAIPPSLAKRAVVAALVADAAAQTIQGPEDPAANGPTLGSFVKFWANTAVTDPSGAPYDPAFYGQVTGLAANDAGKDAWLRVDGTNQMLNHLNAGGFSLIGAKDVEATGTGMFESGVVTGGDVVVTNGNVVASAQGVPGKGLGVFGDVIATDLTTSGGGQARLSTGVYDVRLVETGTVVRKPTCPNTPAMLTPQIFAMPATFASRQSATHPLYSVDTVVNDLGAGGWRVDLQVYTDQGLVPPDNAQIRRLVVFTKCA